MAKPDSKKGREGGGIPRPQATTGSPSKLAIRTSTNRVTNLTKHHQPLSRTISAESKPSSSQHSKEIYLDKLDQARVAYGHGSNRTLVNDKLYPRIPLSGPQLFHPGPQRSQTLSMIPSHSRSKMSSAAKTPGTGHASSLPMAGEGMSRIPNKLSQYTGGSQTQQPPANAPTTGQPLKSIMKSRISSDIPLSSSATSQSHSAPQVAQYQIGHPSQKPQKLNVQRSHQNNHPASHHQHSGGNSFQQETNNPSQYQSGPSHSNSHTLPSALHNRSQSNQSLPSHSNAHIQPSVKTIQASGPHLTQQQHQSLQKQQGPAYQGFPPPQHQQQHLGPLKSAHPGTTSSLHHPQQYLGPLQPLHPMDHQQSGGNPSPHQQQHPGSLQPSHPLHQQKSGGNPSLHQQQHLGPLQPAHPLHQQTSGGNPSLHQQQHLGPLQPSHPSHQSEGIPSHHQQQHQGPIQPSHHSHQQQSAGNTSLDQQQHFGPLQSSIPGHDRGPQPNNATCFVGPSQPKQIPTTSYPLNSHPEQQPTNSHAHQTTPHPSLPNTHSSHPHPNHPPHPTPPPYQQPPPPVSNNEIIKEPTNTLSKFSNNTELIKRLQTAKTTKQESFHEVQNVKDLNDRLNTDCSELRDLCCFLDDDRQKGRKLAREWQRFGRYTASVMRQEVSNYQEKLKKLETKQQILINDNLELKELCLYLDEERSSGGICTDCGGPCSVIPLPVPGIEAIRDQGDGSSSSTNNDDSEISSSRLVDGLESPDQIFFSEIKINKLGLSDEVLSYIRGLEERVSSNEEGREFISERSSHSLLNTSLDADVYHDRSRPEAVNNAMAVLSIHEKTLTEDSGELGDGEKALVREMCNVVWRKLEDI